MKLVNKPIRVSDLVVKFFEEKNIETAFTVSGGGSIFLCDALYKSRKIKYVACHHEQAVAFAAEGYARVKNQKPGLCFVTTGPGGTNTLTGVAASWIDSIPVIYISGQVFIDQTISNKKIRQLGVQEINIVDLVKPITKYSVMVTNRNETLYHLNKAFDISLSGRPGPVWIDIPADIQSNILIPNELIKKNYFISPKKTTNYRTELQIKKIAQLLINSKKPLLHLGHGLRLAGGQNDAYKLLKKFKIPFSLTWNASDLIPHNLSNYCGKPGAFAERGANFIVQSSDLYISIGSRLPFMITSYNSKNFAKNAYKICIDIDNNELREIKKRCDFDLIISMDAKEFISKLYLNLIKLKYNNKNIKNWSDYCVDIRKKYPILLQKFINQKKYVNSYFFINLLSKLVKNNEIINTDMGLSFVGTHQSFNIKSLKQKLFTNSGHAPMGWGLPAAIGACFANNKKRVICLSGDGGLQMNIQELSTVMHHKLPIILFIFNNFGYLTIKQTQESGLGGRIMGADKKSGLSFPNYSKIAKSYGIKFFQADSNKMLELKLNKILKCQGPVICELIMSPSQPQIPKLLNRRTKDGKFAIPTSFEDLYPYLSIEEINKNLLTDKSN
jgi:acetolactate synthase I/II/III large subunit